MAALHCPGPTQNLEGDGGNDDGDSDVNQPAVLQGGGGGGDSGERAGVRAKARAKASVSM